MKFYHATFQAYLTSIKANGLLPGQKQNWTDCPNNYIYLANDMDMAISFCEAAEDTPDLIYDSGICCFEIESDSLDQRQLTGDPNILGTDIYESGCYVYADKIPFSLLRLCWFDLLHPIKISLEEQICSAECIIMHALSEADRNEMKVLTNCSEQVL